MKPMTLVVAMYCCTLSLSTFSQTVVATEVTDNTFSEITVSPNCLKHFARSFAGMSSARWSETDDGFAARFTNNGTKYDVRYDHKGRWRCTITCFPVEQLNKHVARTVHRLYKAYDVFFAQQVRVASGSVYFIKIQKGKEWKDLRIVGSVVEILGEYVRR